MNSMEVPSPEKLKADWLRKYEHDMKVLERKRATDRESSKKYRDAHREERNQKAREYYQLKKSEKMESER